jgi:predicted DNA-binding protein (MmcQ/YjbR family)
MGAMNYGVSIKCPDPSEAAMLIDLGVAERAPYLARGGWVLVRWGAMDGDELRGRLARSYLTVRRSLTKRVQASLGPEPSVGFGQGAATDPKPRAAGGKHPKPSRKA